jgi:hypothetical protein
LGLKFAVVFAQKGGGRRVRVSMAARFAGKQALHILNVEAPLIAATAEQGDKIQECH